MIPSGHVRCALTENYVATALAAMDVKYHYWRSGNTAEIDFIVQDGAGQVIPVEVKSADNARCLPITAS
ncbi:MAG: DUF4143 domain-containing protein [Clostridiales Family XIII bacterium]|nr:DUF4143 domain-containing protein [Clostridiales Family XIII bacterium]